MVPQREVDPAALEGRHRFELEHLPGLGDTCRGAVGELAELPFTPAAIVLDVDEDARPRPDLLRQHQVDEVLESREALALAADQGAESFLLVTVGHDVQSAGLAGLDLDADVEPEMAHEGLEDRLAGCERLGRCLGGLEVCAFSSERAAGSGGHFGRLRRGQIGRTATGGGTVAIVPTRRSVVTWPVVAARTAVVPAGRPILAWPVIARAIVPGPVVTRP